MKSNRLLLQFILALLLPASLLQAQSIETVYRKTIPLGKMREIKTSLSFFAGKLQMDTSTDKLAECYYGYSDSYIEPYVHYDAIGELTIKNKKDRDIPKRAKDCNKWRLSLNPSVQNNLMIEMLAGESDINLSGAKLSRLEYSMLAGEVKLNLSNTSVPKMVFKMTAGEAWIDLTGDWKNDCEAQVSGGVGEINLKVPQKTGVKVYVTGLLGEAKLPGFNKDGKTYTNDAWGKSKHELSIYISGGIGEINVSME